MQEEGRKRSQVISRREEGSKAKSRTKKNEGKNSRVLCRRTERKVKYYAE